jgi:hypothetical protein
MPKKEKMKKDDIEDQKTIVTLRNSLADAKTKSTGLEKEWAKLEDAALKFEVANEGKTDEDTKKKVLAEFSKYDTKFAEYNKNEDAVADLNKQIASITARIKAKAALDERESKLTAAKKGETDTKAIYDKATTDLKTEKEALGKI